MRALSLKKENKQKENKKKASVKQKQLQNVKCLESEGIFPSPVDSFVDDIYVRMSDETYRIVMIVSPINTDYMGDDELDTVKSKIIAGISAIKNRIGVYIQKEDLNVERNIENMKKFKEALDSTWKDIIQSYNIENIQESAKEIKNIDRFYVCFESTNKKFEAAKSELDEYCRVFSDSLDEIEMTCTVLKKAEILQLLYKRFNPFTSMDIDYKNEWELEDVLPGTAVLRKDGRIIEIERVLTNHICLKKYRSEVDEYSWLSKILRVDDTINIGITLNPKEGDLLSKIDKTMQRNKEDSTQKKKFTEEKKTEKQIQGIEDMYDNITDGNLMIYDVNITISIQGRNEQELEDKCRKINGIIGGYRYKKLDLIRKEFDPFLATIPLLINNKITREYTYNLTSDDVAALLPFSSNEYIEADGTVYGKNLDSRTLFILNRRNKNYDNPHLAVVAYSGAGKTYGLGTIIMRELPYMDYTIVIDVVGNYKKMFDFAKCYVISPQGGVILNPFHIRNLKERMSNQDEDSKEVNCAIITMRTLELVTFFKWIDKKMTDLRESIFEELIRETYYSKGFTDEAYPDDLIFPTLSDFDLILEKKINETQSEEIKNNLVYIREIMKSYIVGSASNMFNGQTNYEYEEFTIIDLSMLSKTIQPAVYDLLLGDLWSWGIKDGSNEVGNPPLKSIYIDEAHELARPEVPQTLDFIATKLLKQGRKFGFIVTTATQEMTDYLTIPKYGQAILNNSYFKLFMKLGENDQKIVQELYHLSDKEMKILTGPPVKNKMNKGKGIFSIGGYKVPMKTFAYKSEMKLIDPVGYAKIYKETNE